MPNLNLEKHRENYGRAIAGKESLYLERPAIFSSAAAAQDAANTSRMLWSWAPIWLPWEYTGWMEEGRSFHDTAYIGDWSGLIKVNIKGPQAFEFLQQLGTNDLSKFTPGGVKHHVQLNEHGKIAAQGVLYRLAEDEFVFNGGSGFWSFYNLEKGGWNAKGVIETPDYFLFSVQGPLSRDIVEQAANTDLKDLKFNRFKTVRFNSHELRILRTGITGELGYELHGPVTIGNDVWAKVVEIGGPMGLKQLGVRAQMISHVEAGIATNDRDFVSAAAQTPGAPQILPTARSKMIGSYRPTDPSDLHRTPAELGWFKQVSLDSHEFTGREALLAERQAGGPARRMVGLVWNNADVVKVYATLFQNEPLPFMDIPRYMGLAIDQIHVGGNMVGCSTSRVYSPFLRRMISLGHIDRELASPGKEVSIVWGDPDGKQLEVRAEVVELPFKADLRDQSQSELKSK